MKNDLTGLKFGKITICDEWKNFSKFIEWACENGYKENADLSIDRIDNDGNYEPSNCRWVDRYTKVCIICTEHGEFWQTPYNHINRKHGCPICSRKNRHHIN